MAAILWRKKLVLHRSLAGVSIGINQNPIMHAPAPVRPRDLLSRAEEIGREHSPETPSRRPSESRSGTIRLRYGGRIGGGLWN
ncbi:hypothetical protein SORBI_3004G251350 [Sorghum bicolor]|uniref:Uncharacterized protein n=1 Tax=Sorghum bicolor TaxID=4558 RepID=A0A1Z5RPJ7_SORBI|nr:hypothetical protein SORBI_3004G251350 [Sorghum bicolor]